MFEGCKSGACGWLTDSFGICGQIVPGKGRRNLEPNVMATLMTMVKFAVEAAARQYLAFEPADYINIAASGVGFLKPCFNRSTSG